MIKFYRIHIRESMFESKVRKMKEPSFRKALVEFTHRLQFASHVLPLLENERITVKICTNNNEELTIVMSEKEVSLDHENRTVPSVVVKGDLPALINFIEGKMKLQALQKSEKLQAEGKYRHLLKIESLFYCCPLKEAIS